MAMHMAMAMMARQEECAVRQHGSPPPWQQAQLQSPAGTVHMSSASQHQSHIHDLSRAVSRDNMSGYLKVRRCCSCDYDLLVSTPHDAPCLFAWSV